MTQDQQGGQPPAEEPIQRAELTRQMTTVASSIAREVINALQPNLEGQQIAQMAQLDKLLDPDKGIYSWLQVIHDQQNVVLTSLRQVNSRLDDLDSQVAQLRETTHQEVNPKLDFVQTSIGALRTDIANLRGQAPTPAQPSAAPQPAAQQTASPTIVERVQISPQGQEIGRQQVVHQPTAQPQGQTPQVPNDLDTDETTRVAQAAQGRTGDEMRQLRDLANTLVGARRTFNQANTRLNDPQLAGFARVEAMAEQATAQAKLTEAKTALEAKLAAYGAPAQPAAVPTQPPPFVPAAQQPAAPMQGEVVTTTTETRKERDWGKWLREH